MLETFRERYPVLFSKCRSFTCGHGWFDLLDTLCKQITEAVEAGAPPAYATQVKEKFGTLRFYFFGGNEEIEKLVKAAVEASAATCEECGAGEAGMSALGGFYRTRCPSCYAALRKEMGPHVFDFCAVGDIGPSLLSHRHRVIEMFVELFGFEKVRQVWDGLAADQTPEMIRQVRGALGTIEAKIAAKEARK